MAAKNSLAEAIRQHTRSSAIDRRPEQALWTMIRALFNVLGCRPYSEFITIEEKYYTDFFAHERMKDLRTTDAMVDAYLEQVRANEPFHDVLTDLASEFIGRNGEGLGQFLTPRDMAQLTAEIAFGYGNKSDEFKARAKAEQLIRITDPCGCGTGSLLMAQLNHIHKHMPEVMPYVSVSGVDIDTDMMKATAVQLIYNSLVHNVPLAQVAVRNCNILNENLTASPAIVFNHPWWAEPRKSNNTVEWPKELDTAFKAVIDSVEGL